MAKPVRLRERAAIDLQEASDYYFGEAGEQTALDLIDAVERAVQRIGRSPQIGSLRFAFELGIPDLRAWPVSTFPYVVFYVDTADSIDVWRVLHTRRDIPASLREAET